MKRIVIIGAFMLGLFQLANAQEQYKNSLSGIQKVMIEANSEMTVEVTNGSELIIEWPKLCDGCDDNGNYNDSPYAREQVEKKRAKSKGLTAIYAAGIDNTGLGMNVEKDGEVLRIKDLKTITQRKDFVIRIPKSIKLEVNTSTLGSLKVTGFTSELEVTSNVGRVELVDVTGPITASTSTGAIDVIFTSVNQNAPISLTTATGDIDVSLPSSTKTNIEMNSTMGSVYSNFDLEIPREDGLKPVGGQRKITGALNGGGVNIKLRSSTGDIYLRKN